MKLGVALSIVASALLVPSAVSAAPGDCPFPTRIRTEAELIQLGTDSDCLDETIEQLGNITLTANPWIPIDGFVGTYDGNSRTIFGLRLDGNNAGLFGVGNAGATFRDLDIVMTSSTGGDYVGALVGSADGSITIDNVHVTGNVTGGSNVGGLVGELMSPFSPASIDIIDSSVTGDVTGTGDRVGGLVGNSTGSVTIDNTSVAGDITSPSSNRIGGIAGEVFNPFDELTLDVVDAVVTGDITGSGDYIGGLIGETNATDITITASTITGDLSGDYRIGGLLGSATNFSDPTIIVIDDSTIDGDITGTNDYIGGLIGETNATDITITANTITGDLSGGYRIGGLVGNAYNGSDPITLTFDDNTLDGNITGTNDYIGGLIGETNATDITITANTITGDLDGDYRIGGLLGNAYNPSEQITLVIDDNTLDGNITGTNDYIGGLIGETNATDITITANTITGDLDGDYRIGGLLGNAYNPSEQITLVIDDNTLDGNITGTNDYIGGLIGETNATDITITANIITGDLDGAWRVGGLLGNAYNGSDPITLTIDDTTVSGNITGTNDYIGGLIGETNATDITITASTITGDLDGDYRIGGLIGNAYSGTDPITLTIDDTAVSGNITGTNDYIGGLIGETNATDITIIASTVTGNVSGGWRVGGLLGNAFNIPLFSISIDRSTFTGDVVGTGGYIGGLIGETSAEDISVTTTSVIGTVSSTGNYVGGMVGNSDFLDSLSIAESFVLGDVEGGLYVGGFLGFSLIGTVTSINSFVRGSSTGSQYVGGLIGSGLDSVELTNSYFQGTVTAPGGDSGSFTGGSPVSLTVDQALCTDPACPVGDTVAVDELRSATFLADLGWDMSNTWCIRSSRNDGFPILRAFTSGALDARSCNPQPSGRTTYRVTLDPAGGTCIDGTPRTQSWVADFRGSRHVPGPTDCTRPDHTFVGWAEAETPDTVLSLPLVADPSDGVQRYLVTQDLDLVAVWSVESEPAYIDDLKVLANFLCGPCTTAWLIYTRPPTVTQVSIGLDGTPTTCARGALVFGFTVCELVGLEPGPHTVILTPTRNGADDSPAGLSTSATFTLTG